MKEIRINKNYHWSEFEFRRYYSGTVGNAVGITQTWYCIAEDIGSARELFAVMAKTQNKELITCRPVSGNQIYAKKYRLNFNEVVI